MTTSMQPSFCVAAFLFGCSAALAQIAPASKTPAAVDRPAEATSVLCPFEVSGSNDVGCIAPHTLAAAGSTPL